MLISIIVPVYNVEKYLKCCIQSILNQTYKNIEIILVDDGSTDNSGIICDEYQKKHKNIKVIHKKNEGLGMARNSGMEIMSGDYVTFIDSDDYIDKDLIEKLYINISKGNYDISKSGFKRVNDDGKVYQNRQYQNEIFQKEDVKNILLPRMIGSLPDKKDSIEMCVCASLYNTKYIKEHNIKFPSERVLISEDLIFNIEYMQFAKAACTIDYVGYNYRFNPNSLTKKYREDRFSQCKFLYSNVKERLKKHNYENEIYLRLSRMFFIYLRMCLSQENRKVSNKTRKEAIYSIKNICNDKEVQNIINEYPINKIGLKQRIFLYLIKWKKAYILYILTQTNLV